ncbi:hypothetical protein J6590_014080 [Homalodisca vitripennis]|nr:hypothetical protein J6590_014080 [Homalodisca vitripennis]
MYSSANLLPLYVIITPTELSGGFFPVSQSKGRSDVSRLPHSLPIVPGRTYLSCHCLHGQLVTGNFTSGQSCSADCVLQHGSLGLVQSPLRSGRPRRTKSDGILFAITIPKRRSDVGKSGTGFVTLVFDHLRCKMTFSQKEIRSTICPNDIVSRVEMCALGMILFL